MISEGRSDGLNLIMRGDEVGFEEMTEGMKEVRKLRKVWHTTREVGSTPCLEAEQMMMAMSPGSHQSQYCAALGWTFPPSQEHGMDH